MSARRAKRLQDFILGHLPPGISVDVIITSEVKTAAVLPADVDAVLSSDATDLERAQVTQLLDDIDADYLVLVTGTEADLERIPLNDQLTADHAHQFGLAFHELLHILKTAIVAIGGLLEGEVDRQYHEQVHDLINLVEDGAIESEAIHGTNFSDNAGIRLELTRRIHSATPADIPDDEEVRYSFWDAVTTCLYDEAIYPTGTMAVLLDETDDRITFASDVDEQAFERIHDRLVDLARDALAIRSAERDDTTHSHDKTASIHRARLVIGLWNQHIQPVLEHDKDRDSAHQGADGGEDGAEPADSKGGTGNRDPTGSIDPQDLSLSRKATVDPHQSIFEQPQITDDPDPGEVPNNPETPADEMAGTPAARGIEDRKETADGKAREGLDTKRDEPASRAEQIARVIDRAREEDAGQPGNQACPSGVDSTQNDGTEPSTGQTSLGDFEPSETEQTSEREQPERTDNPNDSDSPEKGDAGTEQSSAEREADGEKEASTADTTQSVSTTPPQDGPAHAQISAQSTSDEQERFEEALFHDKRAARDEAAQGSLDQQGLEQELEDITRKLERVADNATQQGVATSSESDSGSGNSGGPELLTEIEILPIGDDTVAPRDWDRVEEGADQVGQTLETYLQLERQKGERTGLTTGSYDTRAGYRLAIGDPRVCKSAIPGGEKQYAIVFVLDRSYSMHHGSPKKIDVATQAIARFALAAEQLGINVAIIDFIYGDARLVKPFSIETRHVQASLLDTSYGGGTPLGDALGLARTLIETQRDEPLIIAVTDDQPDDIDAVIAQIRASHAPVCSLTIATDQQSGSLPDVAGELVQYYERQETVYSPEHLDDRLDQFASLLAGL